MGHLAFLLLLSPMLAALGSFAGSGADGIKCNMTQQAACGDRCIPVTWLCDGEQDCPDGTDEQCEEICHGHPLAWQCDDGRCVSMSWLCDGVGDCSDGSDEVNCACPDRKIQCPGSSRCLDAWQICDTRKDCEDGFDEAFCPQSRCPAGQWRCKNQACVAESRKCDGTDDCGDSSDEAVCGSCPEGTLRCDGGRCIPDSLVCDGAADCADGADEPATCGKNCSLDNGGCAGQCSDTGRGVQCSCGAGWHLQPDGRSCADIDECTVAYSPCGQLCHNLPGSYSCDCVQGYQLHNGTDCQVTGDTVKILIAADQELGVLDGRTGVYETLTRVKSRPSSVAYDLGRSTYFWVDEVLNVFVLGRPTAVPLYPELKTVNSVSVDWFTGQLYWASSYSRVICAGLSDGRGYVKILEKNLMPEQLIVFPAKKYLYWVNRGEKGTSTVETAGMDGSDRKALAFITGEEARGLTLDRVTGRLYWISKYKKSIETVKVDGSGRYTFPEIFLEDEDPVGLAVFENRFFWANKMQLFHTSPHTPKKREVLLNASVSAFSVLHKFQQPRSGQPACVPDSCSHLCLLSPIHPKGYKCVCPEGMFLLPSGRCSELKLVFSSGKHLYLLKVGFMGAAIEKTLLYQYPRNTYLLDIDWKRNLIYWTNAQGRLFYSTGYSREKQEIGTERSICTANVDIATGHLYWLPCDRTAILKTGSPGTDTHTLYSTGSLILHLLLDWPKGLLYWVESGKHLQSMALDGKHRREVWRGTWTADTQMALDLGSSSILWAAKGRGLQGLSLLKNRTYTLSETWTAGLTAAHEPYVVTVNKTALVLWSRRTLEPWSVLREPDLGKTILVTERHELPEAELAGAATAVPPPRPPPPPLCTRSSAPCRDGKGCIAPEQLCDGQPDCQDGSDEDTCSQSCNRPGVFHCLDGSKCVEEKHRCDGAAQCPDGSDELRCWKPAEDCALRCDNKTRCVPKSWLCDGSPDCSDKKDEQGCIREKCSTSEFRCASGQCISNALHCDGNPDCRDRSDEEGCPAPWPLRCPSGEVMCQQSGECVLAEWVCDRDVDCRDGSDEKDCDVEELRCGSRQWLCASGEECVPDSWLCDGQRDCRDGSDEASCLPKECQGHEFQCRSHACLHVRLVCDGKQDCADGSDEGGQCSPSACSQRPCPHACYPSPEGPVCTCEPGFELEGSGHICRDVDECQKSGGQPCSQTCVNTRGSYSCTCHPGYSLEPDGHTCKATGAEPVLLVAIQFNLFLYGLRSLKEDILATVDKNVIIFSIDYDLVDQKVFWADFNAESIKWISMDTKKKGAVVKGIKPDCIAVDWIGRNLYWTDGTAGQILAVQLTAVWRGKAEYTKVLDGDLNQPRSLALDPPNGLMYWSEIGGEPQIEQAGMDGSSRKILINQGLGWPSSITLDHLSWKIFWSDDKFHCIGSANLDGTGVSMLQLTHIKSPFAIAVFEDGVFWSEMKTRTVQRVEKTTGKNRAVLIKRLGQPYALKIVHEVLQPRSPNPCLVAGCSHLCLLSPPSKGSCQCPVGLLLAEDGISCVPLQESAFVFLTSSAGIMQIYLKNMEVLQGKATLPEHRILPFTSVHQLASMDYVVQEKTLYLSELNHGDIRLLRLQESGNLSWRKIMSVEGAVIDLAVDWLSGNIYWIDSENPHINVASSKGQYPIVLLSENLYRPTSVVLHPPTANMCFVDLAPQGDGGRGSSIECASMDGSRRKVLWQKALLPTGLSFSGSGTRLYWADPGRELLESIEQDGSSYRADRRGIQGLTLFTCGQGRMFWTTVDDAQVTKIWYSKVELSEDQWFQVDQKIVDIKVYSKFSQQGSNGCSKDNGGCSHICLPNPEGRTCKCPNGYSLAGSNKCTEAVGCSALLHSCEDGQKCISKEHVCDGRADCLDGSDEMGCIYPNKTHSTQIFEKPEPGKRPTLKATHPLQTTKTTQVRQPGGEVRKYPIGKTATLIPDRESKTLEAKEGGESVQPRDAQGVKHPPCGSNFCNGRGICTVEGELRRCSCLREYGGEHCEEAARGLSPGHVALSLTFTLSAVLVALGAFVYFRRRHGLKRTRTASSRNLTCYKENGQEEETLMNSETFVNEAYDEQELLTSLQTD